MCSGTPLPLPAHVVALLLPGARDGGPPPSARGPPVVDAAARRLPPSAGANDPEDATAAALQLLEAPLPSFAWIFSFLSSAGDAEGETPRDGLRALPSWYGVELLAYEKNSLGLC
jgi:hypothetical protein